MTYAIPVTFKNDPFWNKLKPDNENVYINGVKNGKFYFHTITNIKGTTDFVAIAYIKSDIPRIMQKVTEELHSHGLVPSFGQPFIVQKQWIFDKLGYLYRRNKHVQSKVKRKPVKKCKCRK